MIDPCDTKLKHEHDSLVEQVKSGENSRITGEGFFYLKDEHGFIVISNDEEYFWITQKQNNIRHTVTNRVDNDNAVNILENLLSVLDTTKFTGLHMLSQAFCYVKYCKEYPESLKQLQEIKSNLPLALLLVKYDIIHYDANNCITHNETVYTVVNYLLDSNAITTDIKKLYKTDKAKFRSFIVDVIQLNNQVNNQESINTVLGEMNLDKDKKYYLNTINLNNATPDTLKFKALASIKNCNRSRSH